MKHKKIAVIFLGDYRYDGRCFNMVNSMIAEKYLVDIYHVSKNSNQPGHIQSNRLKVLTINPVSTKILKYVHWTFLIYNIIKKKTYDNIIASDFYSLVPVCLIKHSKNIIYDSREIYTELAAHYKSPLKKKLIKYVEKWCVQNTSCIITSAKSDTNYLKKMYSDVNIQYHTLFNFPPRLRCNNKSNYLREKYNIKNHQNILLYQGVLQPGRGIKQMIQVIYNTNHNVGIIIGDGELKKYYKKYVYEKKLMNKIYFIDSIPYVHLLKITASADIGFALIHSLGISYKYALPNKLFEYAMCGIPCVASGLPNLKKYIKKYSLGVCVTNELAQQIQVVSFLSQANQKKYYFNNREKDNLSWESQEKKFLNILQ